FAQDTSTRRFDSSENQCRASSIDQCESLAPGFSSFRRVGCIIRSIAKGWRGINAKHNNSSTFNPWLLNSCSLFQKFHSSVESAQKSSGSLLHLRLSWNASRNSQSPSRLSLG